MDSFESSVGYPSKKKEGEDRIKAREMMATDVAWEEANRNAVVDAERWFEFVSTVCVSLATSTAWNKTPRAGTWWSITRPAVRWFHEEGYP